MSTSQPHRCLEHLRDTYQRPPFTQSAALLIQSAQLAVWRSKLSAECWVALNAWVDEKNLELDSNADGYAVVRGHTIDEFIFNWTPSK